MRLSATAGPGEWWFLPGVSGAFLGEDGAHFAVLEQSMARAAVYLTEVPPSATAWHPRLPKRTPQRPPCSALNSHAPKAPGLAPLLAELHRCSCAQP